MSKTYHTWVKSWAGKITLAALMVTGLNSNLAQAQEYPSQDVHLICAFPAGSGSDVVVRYFAEKLKPILKRNVFVDNKPGANGMIAMTYSARAKPDGHVIYLHTGSSMSATMHIFKNVTLDAGTEFQVAATINRQGFMMVVNNNSKIKTVQEMTAFLKTKGDKATYSTSATSGTVMGEMYKAITGVKAVEVTYRIAQDSLSDLQSGHVDYGMLDPQFASAAARQGSIRILGIATGQRMKFLPDIPTMAESGVPGMDLNGWFAAFVPIATPKSTVQQINDIFKQTLTTDETIKFLNQFGGDPWISTPEEGQAFLLNDIKNWGEYVKIAKIEPRG
jgi:tripartite-type tricarboxylate transporter receptor subunit TctC